MLRRTEDDARALATAGSRGRLGKGAHPGPPAAALPGPGAVRQARRRRPEDDARALAPAGSRVGLVKGAYREPPSAAFQDRAAVDAAYARCLGTLMRGEGHPMVGSHDPAMVDLAQRLAAEYGRAADSWEVQMLYGIRP